MSAPGSQIELHAIDEFHLRKIQDAGYIRAFLLNEKLFGSALDFPHYQFVMIEQLDELMTGKLSHPKCLGPILRSEDRELVHIQPERIQYFEKVELRVTSLKSAELALSRLNELGAFEIYLELAHGVSTSVLQKLLKNLKYPKLTFPLRAYDLKSESYDNWFELESFPDPIYDQRRNQPEFSVVIPHFESPYFLSDVLFHLDRVREASRLEVLVVDDGSREESVRYIEYFIKKHCPQLDVAILSWSRGPKIFRAGSCRNMGAHYSRSENLVFLDSDMLVPENFVEKLDSCFQVADVTQFKRLHIPPELSHESSRYENLIGNFKLFIEEQEYWAPLFESENWMDLPQFWKFTCTYALAIRKRHFVESGRFRRNFIQYGFEDTDLGYRLARMGLKFRIEKTPLLHLSTKMEKGGWLFRYNKMQKIKPMAQVFYKLNQDPEIYESLRSLMD